jgi:hypothetical protein
VLLEIFYTHGFMLTITTRLERKNQKNVKDFFNTKKFPGKRGIYNSPLAFLEVALAADGIKPGKGGAKIYDALNTEKGVTRAMNKVKALCEDPNGGCVFWSAGAKPPELLMSGEVVMATGWNGRFFNAIMDGAPLVQVWDGQGLDNQYMVQVKGVPNDANGELPRLVSEPQNFRAGYSETCIIVEYIFEGYGSTVTHVMYVASFNGFCAALMLLQILVRYPVGHATSMALHSFSHRYLETCTVWQYFQTYSYRLCSRVWCPDPGVCVFLSWPQIMVCTAGLALSFSGIPRVFPRAVQEMIVGG